jgi:PPOX class probable F420-dependent enzyme
MTAGELTAFLESQRVVNVASVGRDGWPHVLPLWYVLLDGEVWASTYGKSQKVRNLERDPRATLLLEAGRGYAELRGVMIQSHAKVHRDPATVLRVRERIWMKYEGPADGHVDEAARERLRASSAKRVVIRFPGYSRQLTDRRAAATAGHRTLRRPLASRTLPTGRASSSTPAWRPG